MSESKKLFARPFFTDANGRRIAKIKMARVRFSLRAFDFVDWRDFSFIERTGLDDADLAFYSPSAEVFVSYSARRSFIDLPRLHPKIRAFRRIRRSRILGLENFRGRVEQSFTAILVAFRLGRSRFSRFARRIQSKLQHSKNVFCLRRFDRYFGRFGDDFIPRAFRKIREKFRRKNNFQIVQKEYLIGQ
jgi:hypothetical protein